MKIDLKCPIPRLDIDTSLPQSLPQAVEIPTFTFMIYMYICYAVTVEETEEPVVGQNTLGDTKIKVVKYEDVRGYIENAIEGANFLEK